MVAKDISVCPVIIDTDIGTDIDDTLAICYAIGKGVDINLISTVHGISEFRAKIARMIVDSFDGKGFSSIVSKSVPVVYGENAPLKQRQIFVSGIEGKCLSDVDITKLNSLKIEGGAYLKIADSINTNYALGKKTNIIAIGPLTNIAKVFLNNPGIETKIDNIYMMGNVIITPDNYYLNYRAHNFKVDPEAADIVFGKAVKKTVITTEASKKAWFTIEELLDFEKHDCFAAKYIANASKDWLDLSKSNIASLYDPLVVDSMLYSQAEEVIRDDLRIVLTPRPEFRTSVLNTLKNSFLYNVNQRNAKSNAC
jgi:inosine-uridine nucleoside N-ribohydrolase